MLLAAVLFGAGCDRKKRSANKNDPSPAGPVAVGKLMVTPPAMQVSKESVFEAGEGFFEQQLEILGGPEIRRTAEESVLKSQPEIKVAPMTLQVARVRGSNVVNVIGRGESPAYNSALVDAVMEAYVNMANPSDNAQAAASTSEANRAEKNLKEAERAWAAFRLEHDATRLNAELSAAERSLKRLEVAIAYYEEELASSAKLNLEQDIRRRQAAPGLPSEMPAELAVLARNTLTVAELAYLSGLKGASASATEAARKEAEKDREEKVRSLRKQLEIAKDLFATAQSDAVRVRSLLQESEKLQSSHRAASAAYAEKKSLEKKMGGDLNDTARPVVSIIERAAKAR